MSQYAPFGLCFRKTKTDDSDEFDDAWQYKPPYLPEDLYISVASNQSFLNEPMIFKLPFHQIKPFEYPEEKRQPLNHKHKLTTITKVIYTLPSTHEVSSVIKKIRQSSSEVKFIGGDKPTLIIEFDYGAQGQVKGFGNTIPLVFRC